ncbi:MAG: asparagine synthase, partial [Halofilum sp. (in: g-proteobacteria)]
MAAQEGLLVAITGHPRWLDRETAELASAQGDAVAALAARRRHGNEFLNRIGGDYALVIADPRSGRLLAAIDRFGQVSLYYARCRDGVTVA